MNKILTFRLIRERGVLGGPCQNSAPLFPLTNPQLNVDFVVFWTTVNAVLVGSVRCPSLALPLPLCRKSWDPPPCPERSSSPSSLPVRLAERRQWKCEWRRSPSHRRLKTSDIRVSLSYSRAELTLWVRKSLRTGSLRLVPPSLSSSLHLPILTLCGLSPAFPSSP